MAFRISKRLHNKKIFESSETGDSRPKRGQTASPRNAAGETSRDKLYGNTDDGGRINLRPTLPGWLPSLVHSTTPAPRPLHRTPVNEGDVYGGGWPAHSSQPMSTMHFSADPVQEMAMQMEVHRRIYDMRYKWLSAYHSPSVTPAATDISSEHSSVAPANATLRKAGNSFTSI